MKSPSSVCRAAQPRALSWEMEVFPLLPTGKQQAVSVFSISSFSTFVFDMHPGRRRGVFA